MVFALNLLEMPHLDGAALQIKKVHQTDRFVKNLHSCLLPFGQIISKQC